MLIHWNSRYGATSGIQMSPVDGPIVARMEDERPLNTILNFLQLEHSHWNKSHPGLRFKDTLKRNMQH